MTGIRHAICINISAMKIAMPVWNGRISPVMDTATRILITTRDVGKEDLNYTIPLPNSGIYHRAMFMAGLKIDALICGAISRPFEKLLIRNGIRIYPWVSGNIDDVITAFRNGSLEEEPSKALEKDIEILRVQESL